MFIIKHLHLGEHQFGWLFILAVSGIVLGAYLSGRMAGRCSLRATVRYAYFALFTGAILNLVYNFVTPPHCRRRCCWSRFIAPACCWPCLAYRCSIWSCIRVIAAWCLPCRVSTPSSAFAAGVLSPLLAYTPFYLALGMLFCLIGDWLRWVI